MSLDHSLLETLETLPAGAWTARADGSVDWVSADLVSYFGLNGGPSEDAWPRVVHPGDWPRVDHAWQAAIASGDRYDVNVRLLSTFSGRYRWHLCRAHKLVDSAGEVRWIGLNVDIDEAYREIEVQHASFERLQVERERLRTVFANCPVAISVYQGREHRIAMMNEANRRIVGGRDLEGQLLADAFPEIESQGLIEIIDRVMETGEPYEASEFPVEFDRLGEGKVELGYFSFTLQPLRDGAGVVQGVLSSAMDVTEQVLARRQIGRLAAEREAVLAQLDEGIILADEDGRITFVNARACRLHGVAKLDVGPDEYSEAYTLLREDGSPYPSRELPLARAVIDGVSVVGARWRIRRPDGTEVLVEGSAQPVAAADGQRLGAVLTLHECVTAA